MGGGAGGHGDVEKKNPNHLNKYKETATEQDYKHNQPHLHPCWTHGCSEKTDVYIDFHVYKLESVNLVLMHSCAACPRAQGQRLRRRATGPAGSCVVSQSQRSVSVPCVSTADLGRSQTGGAPEGPRSRAFRYARRSRLRVGFCVVVSDSLGR